MSFGIKYMTIGREASFLPHYTNLIKFAFGGVSLRGGLLKTKRSNLIYKFGFWPESNERIKDFDYA
jgi:hypothetical protein